MNQKRKPFRMNKKVFSIVSLKEKSDDTKYWRKQPVSKRMKALEFLRTILYKDYHGATSRLQRVLSIAQQKTR